MQGSTRVSPVSDGLIDELVLANKILYDQKIVDGLGHISVRHDKDPTKYLMSRMRAPALVEADDIITYDLDSNQLTDNRKSYNERYIHGEIYKARPDVVSIVHCHTRALIPFCVTKAPLQPIYHMSGFLGTGVPVFEIREAAGGPTNMLVRDPKLGHALALSLGDKNLVLMRGHGATLVGRSIKNAVFRAIYAAENAAMQMEAMRLGEVTYLSAEEAALGAEVNETSETSLDRPWSNWKYQLLGKE
ncbi:MAG TPA: class II aldolase/adducin family protein [Stellaceae bacterium]|nr:class II aldolase/adducin family protein [Stellaceae bacterium]